MSYDREMSPLFDPTSYPQILNSLPLKTTKKTKAIIHVSGDFTIILKILEMFEMLLKLMGMGHTHMATQVLTLNVFLSYQF